MSNMNFLIADVILLVSGTIITFSQGDAAKIKSKQFSEFGFWTNLVHIIVAWTVKNPTKYKLVNLCEVSNISQIT